MQKYVREEQVNTFDFWKSYFQIRTYKEPKTERYTNLVLDSIALVLSGNINKSPLKNKQRKKMIEDLTALGHNINSKIFHTRVVKPLLKAKVVYKSEDDMANGEYTVTPNLRRIQKYLTESDNPQVEITMKFNINDAS